MTVKLSDSRPNVVLCLCDQMRAQAVGCYGNAYVRTPNIDRLADGGARFDLAGISEPRGVQGRSLAKVLRGEAHALEPGAGFIETGKMIGIRTPTHLYGLGYDEAERTVLEEPCWLCDLQTDPCQQANLAPLPAAPEAANLEPVLRDHLLEWDSSIPYLEVE